MCGITGYAGMGSVDLLADMNAAQIHRGPDSAGSWHRRDPDVGLAMRRLSIIDVKDGEQPQTSEDGAVVVVHNGEIYNHRELRHELEARGHRFRTSHSDTEVLVHGWEEWGEDLPCRLDGMFAFALWDEHRRQLFCARDRLGIKPFHFSRLGQGVVFASEQGSLLRALPSVEPDRRSMIRQLLLGFLPGPWSSFAGIEQLPPGHWLRWTEGHTHVRRYWSLEHRPASPDQVGDAIEKAVTSHLAADVPIGLTLSGGLDSSFLAAALAASGHADTCSYTVGWGAPSDEVPYAAIAANSSGIALRQRILDPTSALGDLPTIVRHLGEPLSNVTALTAWNWAKFQQESGLKVTLVGEGADEVFGGYLHYRLYAGPFRLLPPRLRAYLYHLAFHQPPPSLVARLLGDGKDVREEVRAVWNDEFMNFFARPGGLEIPTGYDLAWELCNSQLLRVDRMSMAHSIEARVPFLDHRLVEMVWSLPDDQKIRGAVQKVLLRKLAAGRVPEKIIARPKTGPGGTQAITPLIMAAGLADRINDCLSRRPRALGEMDGKIIDTLLQGRAGCYPLLGSRVRDKLLLALYMRVLWHETFIETSQAVPLNVEQPHISMREGLSR